jgi:hypothetical protein
MIIQYSRKNIKNSASSYQDSFLQNQKSKLNNNYSSYKDNNTYNYFDEVAINSLDIADGLKELLIEHGFTLEELSHTPSSELAELLGIDKYIAQIIEYAVAKLSNDSHASYHRLNANFSNR